MVAPPIDLLLFYADSVNLVHVLSDTENLNSVSTLLPRSCFLGTVQNKHDPFPRTKYNQARPISTYIRAHNDTSFNIPQPMVSFILQLKKSLIVSLQILMCIRRDIFLILNSSFRGASNMASEFKTQQHASDLNSNFFSVYTLSTARSNESLESQRKTPTTADHRRRVRGNCHVTLETLDPEGTAFSNSEEITVAIQSLFGNS
jgi:hypothetical protein